MSAMIAMSRRAGMTEMPPFELITGSMVTADDRSARRIGLFVHYVAMGTILFGIGYALLFATFDSASVVTGLSIGIVHGLAVGLVFMPMMPAMHPRMKAVVTAPGEVTISAPGVMGRNWGSMTPMGVVLGHVVYGIVAALVYGAMA